MNEELTITRLLIETSHGTAVDKGGLRALFGVAFEDGDDGGKMSATVGQFKMSDFISVAYLLGAIVAAEAGTVDEGALLAAMLRDAIIKGACDLQLRDRVAASQMVHKIEMGLS